MNFIGKSGDIHKLIKNKLINLFEGQSREEFSFKEITDLIEINIREETRKYSKVPYIKNNFNDGLAFPVGLSMDNIVAHDTYSFGEDRVFNKNKNLLKIDFGIQMYGNIVDSAFTYSNNPKFAPFIDSSKEAVLSVIKLCRPEVYICDIQDIACEIIESYEYENEPLRAVGNVCGHSIGSYQIHSGKSFYAHSKYTPHQFKNQKIDKDDVFAIEFFSTNGDIFPTILNSSDTLKHNHFMVTNYNKFKNYNSNNTKQIKQIINDNIYTLPFSQWNVRRHMLNTYRQEFDINKGLQELYDNGIVTIFPTIYDTNRKTFVGQYEDTIKIGERETVNLTGLF